MTKKRPQSKKPTGKIGPITLNSRGAKRRVVDFPDNKPAIASLVARLFVENASKVEDALATFSNVIPNPENDIDFTVTTSRGEMLLELTKLAPFKELGLTRFDEAPNRFNMGYICDIILNLIAEKSLMQEEILYARGKGANFTNL